GGGSRGAGGDRGPHGGDRHPRGGPGAEPRSRVGARGRLHAGRGRRHRDLETERIPPEVRGPANRRAVRAYRGARGHGPPSGGAPAPRSGRDAGRPPGATEGALRLVRGARARAPRHRRGAPRPDDPAPGEGRGGVTMVLRNVAIGALVALLTGLGIGDFERGNRLYRQGRYAEAVEAYQAALEGGRDTPELRYNLGT